MITGYTQVDAKNGAAGLIGAVYPYPANNGAVVRLRQISELSIPLSLLDVAGRVVWRGEIPSGQEELLVDLRPYSNGVYMLNVQVDGQENAIKLVIQH